MTLLHFVRHRFYNEQNLTLESQSIEMLDKIDESSN